MNTELDIATVADILNAHLGPDGWDIGALERIAEYAAGRGMCIYDHDDPSLDWNQANYEGSETLDMEHDAAEFRPPTPTTETGAHIKRIVDNMKQRSNGGWFDYTIEVRVDGEYKNAQFQEALAAALAQVNAEYDIKFEAKYNPIRFDNQPF